jgi:hypothetical protein
VGASLVLPGVVDTPFFERRGSRYMRRWPKPIGSERVADAIITAVRCERRRSSSRRGCGCRRRFAGVAARFHETLASRFG